MKKFGILALAAMVMCLCSCGQKEIKKQFALTDFATVTLEGSEKYGVVNIVTGQEIIPQLYNSIGYYSSGFFCAQDKDGTRLIDTKGQEVVPPQDAITAKEGYFELTKGDVHGFYFIKTGKTLFCSAEETLEVDKTGNILVIKGGLKGILGQNGSVILPCEYPYLVFDGENYNVAKPKNDKRPIVGKNGKANWILAEAAVYDKTGKLVKKLTAAQAKKIFEAK